MPNRVCLGIDTSCYTTSVACVQEQGIVFSERTMLSVPFGARGLRQSEALFQHVRQLPTLLEHLFQKVERQSIAAVACSATPTVQPQSYMPVFLAGSGQARALAAALDVPCILTDHQSGHIRAAALGNEALLQTEQFFAVHISGGTTDVLLVRPHADRPYEITQAGASTDLHAGQFVDRVGVALGLSFPAGKQFEALANNATQRQIKLPASVQGVNCSFSGAESQARRILCDTPKEELAFAVYDCLARTLNKQFQAAAAQYGNLPFLLCGGVASSALLRTLLRDRVRCDLLFGASEWSSDNAVGTAYLGLDRSALWKH